MRLLVNGEWHEFAAGSVADLLATLELHGRLAVELNGDIIPRSLHASTPLQDQDRLEIVHAIGGG